MKDAILFDLDGTLLPTDNDSFTKAYFKLLAKAAYEWGYQDSELLMKSVMAGVAAMVENDGKVTNHDVFWGCFEKIMGRDCKKDIPDFDKFYMTDFHKAKEICKPAPLAKAVVNAARKKAEKVILATNPLFPPEGVKARLSWIGLEADDFDFITDYTNSCYCKPNPMYYKMIMDKFGIRGENAVMVGNDFEEDIKASEAAGISRSFLITDHVIMRSEGEIGCPSGNYQAMLEFLENL